MKISILEKAYITIVVAIFAGIIVHAPLSVWLGTLLPDYDLLIKSWKEILIVNAVSILVTIITRRKQWRDILQDRLCQIIAVYILLHLLLVIAMTHGLIQAMAGLAIDLRYIIFFGLIYVGLKLFPQYRRLLLSVAIVGASVVVGFATLQFFLPADILSHIGYSKDTIMPYLMVDQNPQFIRVNSTLRGPNPLGAYAGMVLAVLVAALAYKKVDLRGQRVKLVVGLLGLCSLVALWLSYSRSALVAGAIAVLIVVFVALGRRVSIKTWIVSGIAVCIVGGGLIAAGGTNFVSNVIFHDDPTTGGTVTSNEQHAMSLEYGIERMIQQPLGAGVGSTGSASLYGDSPLVIENQYLFIAHEAGWLGLLLFLGIFTTVLVRLWRKRNEWLSLGVFASGVGLGLIGLLQPVWVDDTVSVVWWGLAAIALAGKGMYERKKSK
jgi:hypothetical protein